MTKTCNSCGRGFQDYCAACADFDHYVAEARSIAIPKLTSNDYEAQARSKKVQALVGELDGVLGAVLDVKGDALLIARLLRTDGVSWKEIADCAGVNVPSHTTIQHVIAVYEERGS